jgi:hypothetical protein
MEIIGGLDVHRKQITFDYLEIETGEVKTGQIRPATRERLRSCSPGLRVSKPLSRSRPPRAGATSSRSFKERAVSHTWPNRPRPRL